MLVHTQKIFPEKEQFSVYLEKVNYDLNKKSIMEQQINQMKNSLLTHETYFHKRPAFKHEGEYRLLIADNSLGSAEGLSSFGVKFKIEDQIKDKTDEEIIDYLTERICVQRPDWDKIGDNNVSAVINVAIKHLFPNRDTRNEVEIVNLDKKNNELFCLNRMIKEKNSLHEESNKSSIKYVEKSLTGWIRSAPIL